MKITVEFHSGDCITALTKVTVEFSPTHGGCAGCSLSSKSVVIQLTDGRLPAAASAENWLLSTTLVAHCQTHPDVADRIEGGPNVSRCSVWHAIVLPREA